MGFSCLRYTYLNANKISESPCILGWLLFIRVGFFLYFFALTPSTVKKIIAIEQERVPTRL